MKKLNFAGFAAIVALTAACASAPESQNFLMTAAIETPAPVPSADPHVKFKDGERYLRDLSANLNIPREDICKELSRYDCMSDAFRIVLGGVEAPNLLVNEPIETAALTSPIAVDRVALHVCTKRVRMDQEAPADAVLFKAGAFGKNGRAKSPNSAWLNATADAIYGSILLRSPSAREAATLAGLYKQVADGRPSGSEDVAADWAILSCFAVASSLEAVFY